MHVRSKRGRETPDDDLLTTRKNLCSNTRAKKFRGTGPGQICSLKDRIFERMKRMNEARSARPTQKTSARGALAKSRQTVSEAADRAINDIVTLLEEAATSLDGTISSDGNPPPAFARSISGKLRSGASYLRAKRGDDLVDQGIALARRHPRWFVSGSAATAAIAAWWLISAAPERRHDNASNA